MSTSAIFEKGAKISYKGMKGEVIRLLNEKKKIYLIDFGIRTAQIPESELKACDKS